MNALQNCDEARKRAEVELEYDIRYGIEPITMNDDRYPQRLKDCDDAPLMLFYKGNANLNQQRVINIMGTRHCTPYGEDLIRRFISDLKQLSPRVLIVSGLAYGVDIVAHRQALACGYETVGVLAHGLDDLYPRQHRETAARMIEQGGLLTEFLTQTNADKINFVRRNRIVAGMSDACILIESAAHGGGLITCDISQSYGRDVFAFPGRIGDHYSEGCNNLIRNNGATLITSAEDFVKDMRWQDDATLMRAKQQGIERSLFPELSPEEQAHRRCPLQDQRPADQHHLREDRISTSPASPPSSSQLEMKGVIQHLGRRNVSSFEVIKGGVKELKGESKTTVMRYSCFFVYHGNFS